MANLLLCLVLTNKQGGRFLKILLLNHSQISTLHYFPFFLGNYLLDRLVTINKKNTPKQNGKLLANILI